MTGPLRTLRVVEVTEATTPLPVRLAIAMAGRIAADLGADVGQAGLAGQDPAFTAAERRFLDRGKRRLGTMPTAADAVLAAAENTVAGARVQVIVTAYGIEARADDPASELTLAAESGLTDVVGDPARAPLMLGGHQVAYAGGLSAYGAMAAALCRLGGDPVTARVSLLDTAIWLNWKSIAVAQEAGRPLMRAGDRAEWQVIPCADGWFALVHRAQDWAAMREMIGDPALDDPRFADVAGRRLHGRALMTILRRFFARQTRADIRREALARRIPLGPVWSPRELRDDPQVTERGFLVALADDGADVHVPRVPVLWNGRAPAALAA